MKAIVTLACGLMLGVGGATQAAPPPKPNCMTTNEGSAWKARYPALYTKLMGYLTCSDVDHPEACNVFVGQVAEGVYGVTDFKNPDGTYMQANTIMDAVRNNPAWSKLGTADSQSALDDAGSGAEDHLIIAVRSDQPNGHVALVLPGDLQPSGQWQRNVPNSASAFLNHPEKAYVFCKLSQAFQTRDNVELWWRPKGG